MVIWRYPVEVIINIILAKSVYSSLTFNYLIILRYDPTGMMVIPYIPPLKPWVNPHWTLLFNREGNSLTYSFHTNKNECINLQLGRDTHLLISYSPNIIILIHFIYCNNNSLSPGGTIPQLSNWSISIMGAILLLI